MKTGSVTVNVIVPCNSDLRMYVTRSRVQMAEGPYNVQPVSVPCPANISRKKY